MTNKLYPCLWCNNNAKEMAQYYVSIFPDAKILGETPVVVTVELFGKKIMLLNGGDMYKPTEAFSLVVECDTQEEIDMYWSKLTADGGKEVECGWCKDKYGLSWQIVPAILGSLMTDTTKTAKVMEVVMKTKKFDIEELIEAAK
jgi:predicted 3-demethylubiquinone-9 3-methyltransferase (glyoxalase superfamily)